MASSTNGLMKAKAAQDQSEQSRVKDLTAQAAGTGLKAAAAQANLKEHVNKLRAPAKAAGFRSQAAWEQLSKKTSSLKK